MAWESDPTENARPFQMGMAARNGVTAALLAKRGFGGPDAVFDTGHTVFHAFSRNARPELLTKDLGTRFDGVTELAIKPYPCVSFLHPGLDALFELLGEQRIAARDIKRLALYFPQAGQHCIDGNPLKSHCAQYILPVAAVAGKLSVADIFVDQRRSNPVVAALANRVEIRSDPELDKLFPAFYATIVEVETHDGSIHRKRNDIARGYPENPLSGAELSTKFRQLAGSVATPDRVDALSALLGNIHTLRDVTALADVLRVPASASASK
jgi:2-methylcitrate dehydratase PrpD